MLQEGIITSCLPAIPQACKTCDARADRVLVRTLTAALQDYMNM